MHRECTGNAERQWCLARSARDDPQALASLADAEAAASTGSAVGSEEVKVKSSRTRVSDPYEYRCSLRSRDRRGGRFYVVLLVETKLGYRP